MHFFVFCLCVLLCDILFLFLFASFSVNVYECFPTTHFSLCAVIIGGMCSNEELFLTQNSFLEEILLHNFSIDSILDGLVASDEPVSQNSFAEELKQVVTEESITDGQKDRKLVFSLYIVCSEVCLQMTLISEN